jgi:hypothetical protein
MIEKEPAEGFKRETPEKQAGDPSEVVGLLVESDHGERFEVAIRAIPELGASGVELLDERLRTLVAEPIDVKYPCGVSIAGEVRSGEDIARAIPDVEAFLAEVNLQAERSVEEGGPILMCFFEINEEGQLVMKDDCEEAYGLYESGCQAKIRQKRIVYRGDSGQIHVMTGENCFKVLLRDKEGRPDYIILSEAAEKIDLQSILMVRGLPTLHWDNGTRSHSGECVRMQRDQGINSKTNYWTEDDLIDSGDIRHIERVEKWRGEEHGIASKVCSGWSRIRNVGSIGVLRVKLNFES